MSAGIAAAEAAKVAGQEQAGRKLDAGDYRAFEHMVREVTPGRWLTVNDLRTALDARQVPEGARATLFAWAARRGLIEKVTLARGGRTFELTEKSAGQSAKRAGVVVYERMPDKARAASGGAS